MGTKKGPSNNTDVRSTPHLGRTPQYKTTRERNEHRFYQSPLDQNKKRMKDGQELHRFHSLIFYFFKETVVLQES